MIGTARIAKTLPASGSFAEINVKGFTVFVEKSPDDTVADVPVLRIGSRGGSRLPGYSGAAYHFPDGFDRIFIEGTSATGTIYLMIVTSRGLQIVNPGTAS